MTKEYVVAQETSEIPLSDYAARTLASNPTYKRKTEWL